jgi:multidrug efflux pump
VKRFLADSFDRLGRGYARLLEIAGARRGLVALVGVAWVVLGIVLLGWVPREFMPTSDRSALITFTRAPEGSTLDYTARWQHDAEEIMLAVPEVARSFSVVALGIGAPGRVSEGAMFTSLVPWEDRSRSQQDVVGELRGTMSGVAGIEVFVTDMPAIRGTLGAAPVSLVLQGPSFDDLAGYAEEIMVRARAIPGMVNVQTDLELNKPQLEVEIDRERAADLGVSVRDIASTLQMLVGGLDLSRFKLQGETYDVIARLGAAERTTPRDLYQINVRGADGQLISMASMVTLRETVSARGLPHFDRLRAASVTASLAPGLALGDALAQIRAAADDVLPPGQGYRVTFSGESEDFYESGNALAYAYLLAVVIVFLVLAGQFESFLDPITILVAVALSFTGALVALAVTGNTLNLFSQIGLVMLVGIVTKNSILIVEFANQLQEEGRELVDATLEAARTRFRPILMTAVSTIAGIAPVALGLGAGGEARAPLGIAVVGGMLFSTLLSLFVVPAVHIAFGRLRAWWTRDALAPA